MGSPVGDVVCIVEHQNRIALPLVRRESTGSKFLFALFPVLTSEIVYLGWSPLSQDTSWLVKCPVQTNQRLHLETYPNRPMGKTRPKLRNADILRRCRVKVQLLSTQSLRHSRSCRDSSNNVRSFSTTLRGAGQVYVVSAVNSRGPAWVKPLSANSMALAL